MRWLPAILALLCAACATDISANGVGGNLAWSLTINNTATAPSDGLLLIITYGDGTTSSVTVPPGGTVVVPAHGASVRVSGGGGSWQVSPGSDGSALLVLPLPTAAG